jgi:hypothetical protein
VSKDKGLRAPTRRRSRAGPTGSERGDAVFGRPERCQSTTVCGSLRQFAPSPSKSTEAGPALHQEGVLEALATEAGLAPKEAGYLPFTEEYPNLETMVLEASAGRYRLEDEVRYLIATA